MFYGYCYKYNRPKFDAGSAIPCIEKAVQSLGITYFGDDGKYYQEDVIGDREGEIFAGIFATGITELQYDDLTGEAVDTVFGTATVTISGNSLLIGTGEFSSVKFTSGKITSIESISDDLSVIYGDMDCTIIGTPVIGENEDYISWRNILGYNKLEVILTNDDDVYLANDNDIVLTL